jgi:hypothetical protein
MWHVWEAGGLQTCVHLMERDRLEDLGVDSSIIFKCVLTKSMGSMDWIDLAEDEDSLRILVNAVTFVFHKMRGNSWLAEDLLVSQEGLCSMDLVI